KLGKPLFWLMTLLLLVQFRFKKHEVPVLARAMGVPGRFTCPQGTICDGMEALCMRLRRFCYPCRYSDLVSMFGRPVPELSMITNQVVDFIYDQHAHRLTQWNEQLLSPQCLRRYAEAVAPVCSHVYAGTEAKILTVKGLLTALEERAFVDCQPMCVYGDPAYPLRIHLQAPYRNRPYITPQMEAFNNSMSTVHVAVEWLFGDIINYLKFLDFKKN
ncbi:Hypothetical predicted protein, partial [Paramuricea clavata]